MKKGQFFIIGAIFIVIGIIAIKGMIGFFDTASEKGFNENIIFEKNIANIKNEYRYIAGLSALQSNVNYSGITYLGNFTNLLRDNFGSKILYVYIFTNASTNRYSVTVGNFLNDRINILVNVTDSTTPGYLFGLTDDKTNVTSEFQASSSSVNITLKYDTQTEQITEVFSVNATKYSVTLFTDITLYTDNILLRTKDIFNRTW